MTNTHKKLKQKQANKKKQRNDIRIRKNQCMYLIVKANCITEKNISIHTSEYDIKCYTALKSLKAIYQLNHRNIYSGN